jgi:putative phage-type endonuclease
MSISAKPDRRTFLGGSEAAAILGVSPWATPLDIYRRKRGEVADDFEIDPQKMKILKRGKRMEPIVIDMLIDERGLEVTKRSTENAPNRYQDAEHPFLASEIDFEWRVTEELASIYQLDDALVGTIQNGEIKTVHPFGAKKYGEEDTDEIPIEYAAQAMHGLMITGRKVTMFGVLVGSDNLLTYIVKRDEETIAGMRAKELAFWNEHVVPGVPPAAQNLPDIYHLFKKLGESSKEATPEVLDLITQYKTALADAKDAEDAQEELKFKLGEFLLGVEQMQNPSAKGRHQITHSGAPLITVDFQQVFGVSEVLVKTLYPKIAKECVQLSQFFVYRVNKPKRART